jgi:hypothetical protein
LRAHLLFEWLQSVVPIGIQVILICGLGLRHCPGRPSSGRDRRFQLTLPGNPFHHPLCAAGACLLISTHVGNPNTRVGISADAAGESARATIWNAVCNTTGCGKGPKHACLRARLRIVPACLQQLTEPRLRWSGPAEPFFRSLLIILIREQNLQHATLRRAIECGGRARQRHAVGNHRGYVEYAELEQFQRRFETAAA